MHRCAAIPSHSSVSYTDAEKLILQVDELEKIIELAITQQQYGFHKCLLYLQGTGQESKGR